MSYDLRQCVESDQSLELMRQSSQETAAGHVEQPPWVVFPDAPTFNVQGSLILSICDQLSKHNLGLPQCCFTARMGQGVTALPLRRKLLFPFNATQEVFAPTVQH